MNSRRHTNRLNIGSLLRWVTIAVFLGAAGLGYVYLKNQLHVCGAQRKELENQLRDLIGQNNVMDAQISKLTALTTIQRRVDEGFVKLVPIDRASLVAVKTADVNRWQAVDRAVADDTQLRTISHERTATP